LRALTLERGPVAELTIIVCDVCAKPAEERITFRVRGRSLQKDLCREHIGELVTGARAVKRGRPPTFGGREAPESKRRGGPLGRKRPKQARPKRAAPVAPASTQ